MPPFGNIYDWYAWYDTVSTSGSPVIRWRSFVLCFVQSCDTTDLNIYFSLHKGKICYKVCLMQSSIRVWVDRSKTWPFSAARATKAPQRLRSFIQERCWLRVGSSRIKLASFMSYLGRSRNMTDSSPKVRTPLLDKFSQ